LRSTNQVLPVVYFDNLALVPTAIPLTFQVDMGAQIAQGNFDPMADTVSVAGDSINNWNATASPLANSASDTNLWVGTFDVTSTSGSAVAYKFVVNGSTWESIDNRAYTLTSTNAQTLPRAFFNNVSNLGALLISPVSGNQTTLTWTACPLIRLQSSSDLKNGLWQDVPNTLGQGSATVTLGTGPSFFRLIGP
jgi:hypothetical protein